MSEDLQSDMSDQETTKAAQKSGKGKRRQGGQEKAADPKAARAVDPRTQQMLDVQPRWFDKLRGPIGGLAAVVIIVGLGVLAMKGEPTTPVKVLGIAGAAMLLFWLATGLAGLWAGPGRRSAQASAQNLVWGLLLIVFLGLVNWMAYRRNIRVDVTEGKYYALSEQTLKVVNGIEQDVTMTAFVAPEAPASRLIRNTVREYKLLAQPKLEVNFLDPKRAATGALMESMDVAKQENTIVVKSGDKTETVHIYQPEKLEEKITSAILAVTTGSKPKVYFLSGHGEYLPDPEVYGAPAWSVVKTLLTDQQYEVGTLDFTADVRREGSSFDSLFGGDKSESDAAGSEADETDEEAPEPEIVDNPNVKVPADCACLVIAGAQTPLFPEETKAIKDYLNSNGHVVIALGMGTDADMKRMKRPTAPDFNDVLAEYQIRVGEGWVIEPSTDIFGQQSLSDFLLTTDFGNHAVTRNLTRVAMPVTRPVHFEGTPEPNSMGGPPPPSMGWEIIRSSDGAWAESNPFEGPVTNDEEEEDGPIPLAVTYGASEEDSPNPVPGAPQPPDVESPRIVVFGSAIAFIDRYADDANLSNYAVITKAIAWASGRADLVTIPAKHQESNEMSVARNQRNIIRLVYVLVLLLVVGTGGYVWWRRR